MIRKALVATFLLFSIAADIRAQTAADSHTAPFSERIYLRTDKSEYLNGEILWWKAYYTNAITHQPENLSKVLYVELRNDSLRSVLSAKIKMDSDGADGSFFITGLPSGDYLLRGYTRWMKTTDPGHIFFKKIRIINPAGGSAGSDTATISFQPEGGHLVAGVANLISYMASDAINTPRGFSAHVITSSGDTAYSFSGKMNTAGSFSFSPSPGVGYRVHGRVDNGIAFNAPLYVEQSGCAMHVSSAGEKTTIEIEDNNRDHVSLRLDLVARQVARRTLLLPLTSGRGSATIADSVFAQGVNEIVISDEHGREIARRSVFRRTQPVAAWSVNTDREVYQKRKPVQLSIAGTKMTGTGYSVAIYRVDSAEVSMKGGDDFLNRIVTLNLSNSAADELMLQYPREAGPPPSTSGKADAVDSLVEIDGHIIAGRVQNSAGLPLTAFRLTLAIPSSRGDCYLTETDSAGRFWFDVRNYFGTGKIYIQAMDPGTIDYRISVNEPFDSLSLRPSRPLGNVPDNVLAGREKQAIGVQVQNIFWSPQLSKTYLPEHDTLAFYGSHYVQYKLDDYVRFTSMDEVLREYVPEVNVRRRGDKNEFFVLDPPNRLFFPQAPLILIDGVAVDANHVVQYDPLKVRLLRVTTNNYHQGPFFFGGVVSFFTYREAAEDVKVPTGAWIGTYDGFQPKTAFFSPQYPTALQVADRKPDFRNLLYWEPNAAPGNNGQVQLQFFTGDIAGRYLISVEGLDNEGQPSAAYSTFEVK